MKNLITRALSGAVYVALVISTIFFLEDGAWYLALILGIPALLEWHSFKPEAHSRRQSVFSILLFLLALACIHPKLNAYWEARLAFMALSVALFLILDSMFQESETNEDLNLDSLFRNSFGILYILGPLLSLVALSFIDAWVLGGVFILIWCFDSFAYLVGRFLGSHKMMPRISPKKTWEGFIGGTIFTAGAASLIWKYSGSEVLSLEQWLLLSVLVVASATLGDLFESALKRKHNLKDSGNMMPGHGGILDRIDSLLFVMPVSFLFLILIATK